MIINFRGKKISVSVKEVVGINKYFGLMFRSRNTRSQLFEFKKPLSIHSFFVFFRFLAIWLDDKNNVVGFKIVSPFTLYVIPKSNSKKLIEVPINQKNLKILKYFVD